MDWKKKHANESDLAWKHEIVESVIDEQLGDIIRGTDLDEGLVKYGLIKIAMYSAQVARAQALGFDPNLLRLTRDEANEELFKFAERIVNQGGSNV